MLRRRAWEGPRMGQTTRSALAEVRHDVAVSVGALASSFGNRDLARAQLALLAFSICEWASFIALMVFAFDDGGASMVGLISLVQLIPAALPCAAAARHLDTARAHAARGVDVADAPGALGGMDIGHRPARHVESADQQRLAERRRLARRRALRSHAADS